MIDVYRDRSLCAYNIVKLALYISLFPQLIAGPIVIYHDVADQIDHRQTNPALTADGIRRFVIGLSKKLLIANTTGRMADLVFTASASQLDAGAAWIGAVCYMLQIYFDFSGYSDMAIGLGRMFGFQFLENFPVPYISSSIKEFWRRWHISLSSWFRDYLYIPLGGNPQGQGPHRAEQGRGVLLYRPVARGLLELRAVGAVARGVHHPGGPAPQGRESPQSPGPCDHPAHRAAGLRPLPGGYPWRAPGLCSPRCSRALPSPCRATPSSGTCSPPLNLATVALGALCSLPLLPWVRYKAQGDGKGALALRVGSYALSAGLYLLCVMNLAGSAFNPFIYFRF